MMPTHSDGSDIRPEDEWWERLRFRVTGRWSHRVVGDRLARDDAQRMRDLGVVPCLDAEGHIVAYMPGTPR
jgi:hypothetical protein